MFTYQQQKAVPMVSSPSLRVASSEAVQSGWVALPMSATHKSFVGSADRDLPLPTGGETDLTEVKKEKKFEEKKVMQLTMGAINRLRSVFASSRTYPVRLSGTLASVNASSSQALLLALWDPTGLTEFGDFAVLFTEYRVICSRLTVWFPNQTTLSAVVVMIAGSDPGSRIVSVTAVNARNLDDSKSWNPSSTRATPLTLTSSQKDSARAVQAHPLCVGGFLPTNSAWGGQTVVYTDVPGAGTSTSFIYQQEWEIAFRCRV
jgi:hypothetical protein